MNNNFIEVTPPDIHALDDGVSILLLGNNQQWFDELKDFANKTFTHSPVGFYYANQPVRSDNIHWAVYHGKMCDYCVVDLESVNELELTLALVRNRPTFFICNPNSKKEIRRILHSREEEMMIFDTVKQLQTYFTHMIPDQ